MRYCYFADYEIQMGERLRIWGQATLVHEIPEGGALDPEIVLARVRQQAATAHGTRPCEVRIRALNRLD
ncbi:hypothetical protein [Lysobacter niastensis]|nr:hypothetical protein [Lysobacter niastensis]